MTDKLAQLLQAVASSSDNKYLKDIAELVYRVCVGEIRVLSGEEMWRFVSQPHESHFPQQIVEEHTDFLDRRLTDLCVRNFRTYSHTADNKMCGVRLHKKGNPLSVFMVGSNGSGKSSLFAALEALYSCNITTKSLMNIADDDNYELHDFGKEGNINKAEVEIAVRFADNTIVKRNLAGERYVPICPPSAFCSDYDVEQVSRHKLDLTPFILSQNGYGPIYDFHSHILSEWISDLDELRSSKQIEQQRLNVIDISKENLLAAYVTLLTLTQMQDEGWQNVDFGYYIKVCDDIFEAIISFQEAIMSIDKENNDRALPEMMKEISGLIKRFREIKEGQANKQPYFTIRGQWNDLIKSLGDEEHRLSDDAVSLANDIITGNDKIDFVVKDKASALKKLLRRFKEDHKKVKENNNCWPQIQDNYLRDLSLLQADEDAEITVKNFIFQVSELRESVSLFQQKLHEEIDKIIDTIVQSQGESIDEALAWFAKKGERFHFHKDEASGFPVVTILYKRGDIDIDTYPSLYLNTFRFRLFVITLKIALAFSFMQHEKVLVPIVIDEVFNSSDFENRLRLEEYVQIIYSIYDRMHISTSRLQLILFTHDEVVLRSFVRGAAMRRKYDFNECMVKDYLQVRLFSQKDAEKLNKVYEKAGDNEYLCLYMPIS